MIILICYLAIPLLLLLLIVKLIGRKERKERNAFVDRMTKVALINTNEKVVLARLSAGEKMTENEIKESILWGINE